MRKRNLLAVIMLLFGFFVFAQNMDQTDILILEKSIDRTGYLGGFYCQFLVENDGRKGVSIGYISWINRPAFLPEVVVEQGAIVAKYSWIEFGEQKLIVIAPEYYSFPNSVGNGEVVVFGFYFPAGWSFDRHFRVRFITAYDKFWQTFDLSKRVPIGKKYFTYRDEVIAVK